MKVIILGCGRQGLAAASILKENKIKITFVDNSIDNLNKAKSLGFNTIQKNINTRQDIVNIIKDYEFAICALPAKYGRMTHIAAIQSKTNLIDVSYAKENPLELHNDAQKANIIIVPDAGIAPGISNLIAGHITNLLDKTNSIKIFVGGIPEKRIPPIDYFFTWSEDDLIQEYLRPAYIKVDSRIKRMRALSDIKPFVFEDMGDLESFYTDGLRTLLYTLNIPNIEERTIRYSGHADKMKFLRELGYFNDNKSECSPLKVTISLFKKIKKKDIKDIIIMRIIGKGIKNNKYETILFDIFDKDDNNYTAMERTTGFALGAFSLQIIKRNIDKIGVIPPEYLGMNLNIFNNIIKILRDKNISISNIYQTYPF